MTFFLGDQQPAGGQPLGQSPTTSVEAFSAAAQAERIRLDSWGLRGKAEQSYYDEMLEDLGNRVTPDPTHPYWNQSLESKLNTVFDQLGTMDRQEGPTAIGGLPRSKRDFDTEIDRRLRAQYDEAQEVLGLQPDGAWVSELAGNFWAGASDEATVITLPFGASTGAPLWKIMAMEFALGVGSEALMLPRQFDTAERLDLPDPDVLTQLATAGITSAGLGGIFSGGLRFGAYVKDRRAASLAGKPDTLNEFEHDAAIADAQAQLENDEPVKSPTEIKYPIFGEFDFGANGNASPKTNRIGYVFGKLLEGGMEPHIAAGMVGNLVGESGAGLHTGAIGDGGNAIGIGQWNGPRKRQLEKFAAARERPWTDLDTQVEFLLWERASSEAASWRLVDAATTAREAAVLISNHVWRPGVPHLSRRVGAAELIARQFEGGTVPKWLHEVTAPGGDAPTFTTSRGFTTDGTVTAGDRFRVDVEYQVVDASILHRASGRLQPRDRSSIVSDEQVAEIAARLDPARLMPSPEADRGAPVVGPDNMIESGNGRVMAIERAYARHPDRADAYREQMEAAGYDIPDGIEHPILIARRTSELDDDARQAFAREANTSAVARMSASERSAADAAGMDAQTIGLFQAGHRIGAPENKPFVQRALANMPQAERNALVGKDGVLNAEGVRRLNQAMFARAYDAQDIVARYTETDAGELKSLMDALETAAPEWAAMRADVAAGILRPDVDITPFVLDAMRLIGNARDLASRGEINLSGAIEEMLADVDLLAGALSPLTVALVRKFWRGGKAAPADKIADFLKRYANEARKVARAEAGLFGEAPGPAQILRSLDKKTFGDLPDELGNARLVEAPAATARAIPDEAFKDGASSPEVKTADEAATADLRNVVEGEPFGPVHGDLRDQPEAAIERLMKERDGEVPEAFVHPEHGPVAFVYGRPDEGRKNGFGLSHIEADHDSETLMAVPTILRNGDWERLKAADGKPGSRVHVNYDDGQKWRSVVVLDYQNQPKTWVLTAFRVSEKGAKARRAGLIYEPPTSASPNFPDATGQSLDSGKGEGIQDIAALRADFGEIELDMPDGTRVSAGELLDDIEADVELADILDLCNVGGKA